MLLFTVKLLLKYNKHNASTVECSFRIAESQVFFIVRFNQPSDFLSRASFSKYSIENITIEASSCKAFF